MYQVDLNSPPIGSIQTIDDIVAALKERAAQTRPGQWIVGRGYDDTLVAERRAGRRRARAGAADAGPPAAAGLAPRAGRAKDDAAAAVGLGTTLHAERPAGRRRARGAADAGRAPAAA